MINSLRKLFFNKNEKGSNQALKNEIAKSANLYDIEAHPRVQELKDLSRTFGSAPDHCPYCGTTPSKLPKRKSKCKECGEYIYPRKNALTKKPIFIKESELELHKELEAYANGTWRSYEKERQWLNKGKERVAKAMQTEDISSVPDNDARWSNYTTERLEASANLDWYKYKNITFNMIVMFNSEHKERESIYGLISEFIFLSLQCLHAQSSHGLSI